jgi:SAM-dependent MidA family methyltransferase
LAVANEFFDALPVHQLVSTGTGWCERLVDHQEGCFIPVTGPLIGDAAVPEHLRHAPPGTILETSPASSSIAAELASRLASQGGAALIIDYGHERTSIGETLQAVASHAYASPWEQPGECDLTAHVDFQALIEAARTHRVQVFGPKRQGEWLLAMGIDVRAAVLAQSSPHLERSINTARDRLVRDDEMGRLFKVVALVAEGWPQPVAF